MSERKHEIGDDQIMIISHKKPLAASRHGRRTVWAAGAVVALLLIAALVWLSLADSEPGPSRGVFEQEQVEEPKREPATPLGDYTHTDEAYVEHLERTINDVVLDIYIPHNAKPVLSIGMPDYSDSKTILALQAADIRADNGRINGAFVLKGKPLAWGLSKKGYVSIIADSIRVGVADNSPLFEEATEKDGYFFRQYALVDEGRLVENEPKNKSYRRAICERAGEILVVVSRTQESFHDFAQALVDFQVRNAVYLVGSDARGFCRDRRDSLISFSALNRRGYRYENYILWRKK